MADAASSQDEAEGHVQPPSCAVRSEEHTSELQSHSDLVCRLLLEKKKPHSSTPLGVDVDRIQTLTFAPDSDLARHEGLLGATNLSVSPDRGWRAMPQDCSRLLLSV